MTQPSRPALQAQPTSNRDPSLAANSDRSPTILLVDDDPGICDALQRVLSLEGWRVVCAQTGEEALRQIQRSEPDLLITDLCMAKINGWDLLFHEKMQRPWLPIFVITALPDDATGGADRFATEFFQKPLDIEALIQAARKYLKR
jgi:DNA-binding NtrC family response regulator